jgi:serpin B
MGLLGNVAAQGGREPEKAAAASTAPAPLSLSKAQARLGFRLVAELPRQPDGEGNILVSPASAAAVLALLDLGANPDMRTSLYKALAFDKGTAEAAASGLESLRASFKSMSDSDTLTSANAIVFDPKTAPYPQMATRLAEAGAQVSVEDLNDAATIRRINEWVEMRTRGLIPTIIEQPPRDAGLVALNALHFKDRWKNAFDASLTRPALFHRVLGRADEVPMMQLEGRLHLREQGAFVAVELPYATDRFRLVVITTKEKPARAAEFREVADWLAADGFAPLPGEMSMPRFRLAGGADLLAALDTLGLRPARLSPDALGGLSASPMTIAQVLQRTEIRVDEAGTEAAAATAVTTTRAVATDFAKVTVDKPFLFALRDAASGLVLLTGYVASPKDNPS